MRIALVLLSAALFASCSCQRDADDDPAADSVQDAATQAAATPPTVADAAAIESQARLQKARYAAYMGAVDTVQAYLSAVGAQDWKKADPYWTNGQPGSGESNLRALEKLHSLRIENDTPRPLDDEPTPKALEVPVTLRASFQDDRPMQRYRGWYRVRTKVSGDGWEITSASIDAVPR